jgi:hypothetical protein
MRIEEGVVKWESRVEEEPSRPDTQMLSKFLGPRTSEKRIEERQRWWTSRGAVIR